MFQLHSMYSRHPKYAAPFSDDRSPFSGHFTLRLFQISGELSEYELHLFHNVLPGK